MAKPKKCTIKRQIGSYQVDLKTRYPCDKHACLVGLNSCLGRMFPRGKGARGVPDDSALMLIAGMHSITQIKFEDMIGEFFFPNQVPGPVIKTAAEMDDLIKNAVVNKIDFDYDETDRVNNAIVISDDHKIRSVYSAYLFQGINLLYPKLIVEFHFYKAIDNGDFTTAIAAIDKDSKVLYLGELAGLYP